MNINLSMNNRTSVSTKDIDHLISTGSIPIITLPTRVTDTSSTIIDQIITNDTSHIIKPRVIRSDSKLSDHYCIFCEVIGYAV